MSTRPPTVGVEGGGWWNGEQEGGGEWGRGVEGDGYMP